MKKILAQLLLFTLLFQLHAAAQQPVDEEKVKKAVVLQKKMLQNPGEMMSIMEEIKTLKLNSAENKEVRTRMASHATDMINKSKQQAISMGGISEQQVKNKMEEANQILPVKDMARINAVLKRNLADGEIKAFCKAVHEAVKKKLDAKLITQAETFYSKLKATSPSATDMGNGAISCYLANLTKQSVYIMGRVCSEEKADANTLNNYAALLTNHGVEEGALPLLNYLNRTYPQDPVVLSNIALAWLGLGDLSTAGKYADTCIRFFPSWAHQAHYVKSIEKESTGDRQGAAEELKKSAGQVYSAEKESVLRKWGGKMESGYSKRRFPADALGLSKFNYPKIPYSAEEVMTSSEEWQGFRKELDQVIREHQAKTGKLNADVNQNSKAMAEEMMAKIKDANGRPGYYFAANNNQNMGWMNLFNTLSVEYAFQEEKLDKEYGELRKKDTVLRKMMLQKIEELNELYENTCGEGQGCPSEAICNSHKKVYDEYLGTINPLLDAFYQKFISFKRRSVNELVYAAKYAINEAEYERYKNDQQLNFLGKLRNVSYRVWEIFPDFGGEKHACMKVKPNPFKSKGLQRFEDIHCPPDWKLYLPGGSEVSTHCTKLTLKLAIDIKAISASISRTEDLLTGEWTNATIELGTKIGTTPIVGTAEDPIIKADAGAGSFIEIDRQGISDWGVKGKAGIGNDAVGVKGEVKISLMSGKPSFSAKSELKGAGKEIASTITKNY